MRRVDNSEIPVVQAGFNLSWGSVFAGTVTFLAFFITFLFIGSAIGFGMVNPLANNPLDGVGDKLIIWVSISIILSLGFGGFVSGLTSIRTGFIHGFLSWATSSFVVIILSVIITVNIVNTTTSLISATADKATDITKSAISVSADTIYSGFNTISEAISNVDTSNLDSDVQKYLKNTKIEELQPDYLKNILAESSNEVKETAKKIITNPNKSSYYIDQLSNSLEKRANNITQSINKDSIAKSIEANTELNAEDSQKAAETIISELDKAIKNVQINIKTASNQINQTKQSLKSSIDSIRKSADNITNKISEISIGAFIAMFIGMLISSFAGLIGSKVAQNRSFK